MAIYKNALADCFFADCFMLNIFFHNMYVLFAIVDLFMAYASCFNFFFLQQNKH